MVYRILFVLSVYLICFLRSFTAQWLYFLTEAIYGVADATFNTMIAAIAASLLPQKTASAFGYVYFLQASAVSFFFFFAEYIPVPWLISGILAMTLPAVTLFITLAYLFGVEKPIHHPWVFDGSINQESKDLIE